VLDWCGGRVRNGVSIEYASEFRLGETQEGTLISRVMVEAGVGGIVASAFGGRGSG
jgi:hypothetical protein